MSFTAQDWITHLALTPHPEGGYFREVYRAPESVTADHLPSRFNGDRCFSTSIYFLLESHQSSAFHRIQSDELWYFHAGSPLIIHSIAPNGTYEICRLGNDPTTGAVLQAHVPARYWFGAHIPDAASFALVSCAVAPGFEFADFELANPVELQQKYPQHQAIIEQLSGSSTKTRP